MPLLPDPPTAPVRTEHAVGEPSVEDAVTALRALILASQEFRQAVANRVGIGVTDTVAMSYLATEGPLGARDLADRMGIATSSVTTVIDRLELAGMARREPLSHDRRAIAVVLTDLGAETLGWTRQWMRAAVTDLGPERLASATDMLRSLAGSLRAQIDTLSGPDSAAPETPARRRR